jgi:hypothetical protein
LRYLNLNNAEISDPSIETLRALPQLRELNLYHTLISPAAYEELRKPLPECRIIYDAESNAPHRRRS